MINNLELDHADIFDDLEQIQTQFHHLLRTVPGNGLVIAPTADANVDAVLERGCWTPVARFGPGAAPAGEDHWQADAQTADGSRFELLRGGEPVGTVSWSLIGEHNMRNALAAVAAARHAGVAPAVAIEALCAFSGVKRRLERIIDLPGLAVYDDFAHHPTAIASTLRGLRARVGAAERIVAVVEPGTHTMSLGALRADLAGCCAAADQAFWFRCENIRWDVGELARASPIPAVVKTDIDELADAIVALARDAAQPCHVVLMSNGAFGGIYAKLKARFATA